jgi:uncharacterized protein YyaL (SSP411 family)
MSETESGQKLNRQFNRLANETSPYLLQHKANPVDWYPWGDEAFARAQAEDKPILLSVGYAACHWCHVMAHESFENTDIAARMNALFVNIKVDREERPDVDALYMSALHTMGQQGGWPLTMFLTSDGKPFLGGTYFPPTPRYGAPAFPDVLTAIAKLYAEGREKVTSNVAAIADALERQSGVPEKQHAGLYALSQLDDLAENALGMMDYENGGTRGAPKFPQPMLLSFLWRAGRRTRNELLQRAVTVSLDHMCQGGIYDHVGGGFARYSTDERWLAPHFEKMLYDNAQLVDLLGLVWAATGNRLYEIRLRESIDWSLRELVTSDGAFAGTLDADSEGEEGRFYVWSEDEIDSVLGADATHFKRIYDVRPAGNWEGHTILNRLHAMELLDDQGEMVLAVARAKLFDERSKRVRPGLDDKILADWNGLMIAALASASLLFDEPHWLAAARHAYSFVITHMQAVVKDETRLRHSYREGVTLDRDVIDDYAQMIRAALALYQATGEGRYLSDAIAWEQAADAHFWDKTDGGYFLSADDATDLMARTRTAFDNATPSGNGTMVENLARLFYLTGDEAYRTKADTIVDIFTRYPPEHYINMPGVLMGYELLAKAVQVVVIGKTDDPDRRHLVLIAAQAGVAQMVLTQIEPGMNLPTSHAAAGKEMVATEGSLRATAYVCIGQTCGLPITDGAALAAQLGDI